MDPGVSGVRGALLANVWVVKMARQTHKMNFHHMNRNNHHNLVEVEAAVQAALVLAPLLMAVLLLLATVGAFALVEDNHKRLIHRNNQMIQMTFHFLEVEYLCLQL